jgi:hypothetical protein
MTPKNGTVFAPFLGIPSSARAHARTRARAQGATLYISLCTLKESGQISDKINIVFALVPRRSGPGGPQTAPVPAFAPYLYRKGLKRHLFRPILGLIPAKKGVRGAKPRIWTILATFLAQKMEDLPIKMNRFFPMKLFRKALIF